MWLFGVEWEKKKSKIPKGSNGNRYTKRRGNVNQGSCPWRERRRSCHILPAIESFQAAMRWLPLKWIDP